MRQLLGKKKVNRLKMQTGLDIVAVFVRGGTDHRKDLCIRGGKIISMYKDGSLRKTEYTHSKG